MSDKDLSQSGSEECNERADNESSGCVHTGERDAADMVAGRMFGIEDPFLGVNANCTQTVDGGRDGATRKKTKEK